MNGLKKKIAGWIAIGMLGIMGSTMLPIEAIAEDADLSGRTQEIVDGSTFDDGILTYTVLQDNQVSVTSCVSTATNVSIMPTIDSYDIVSIGDSAFAGCENLLSITIPSSVTEIGAGAFQSCSSLKKIILPDSITEVPDGAFVSCTSLESVTLGNDVTDLGRMAFGYCTALTEFTVPNGVTEISDQLFYNCTSLESVTLPEHITTLGAYTFQNCTALTEFTIPDALTDLGYLSFLGCQNLETLHMSDENEVYTLQDGIVYSKDLSTLYFYPGGIKDKTFTVPETTTFIYDAAFFGTSSLQKIILPSQLQEIGAGAFDYCSSLKQIEIPASVTVIGSHAFSDCTALEYVTFAGDQEVKDPALSIGEYAFYCCERLMDVTLPKRVTEIGAFAFGVTEQSVANEDGSVADEMQNTAVNGFLLTGYEGAAASYISSCRKDGIRINFKSLEIPWLRIVGFSLLGTAILILIFVGVRMIHHRRMTAEEKVALREAAEERKIPLSKRETVAETDDTAFDDEYESILESNAMLHQFGHDHDKDDDMSV